MCAGSVTKRWNWRSHPRGSVLVAVATMERHSDTRALYASKLEIWHQKKLLGRQNCALRRQFTWRRRCFCLAYWSGNCRPTGVSSARGRPDRPGNPCDECVCAVVARALPTARTADPPVDCWVARFSTVSVRCAQITSACIFQRKSAKAPHDKSCRPLLVRWPPAQEDNHAHDQFGALA